MDARPANTGGHFLCAVLPERLSGRLRVDAWASWRRKLSPRKDVETESTVCSIETYVR